MRSFLLFLCLGVAAGCGERSAKPGDVATPGSTADTAVIPYQTDTGGPVDTDDHNKPGDTIVLDSPVGPTRPIESVR